MSANIGILLLKAKPKKISDQQHKTGQMNPGPVIGGVDIREVAGCECLRLRRVTRSASRLYDRALSPCGLTVSQFGLLSYLYGSVVRTGAGLAIGRLAQEVGMDPTSLNRSLKPLEAAGFVRNGVDPADSRIRTVAITEAGETKLAQATPLWKNARTELHRHLGLEVSIALNGLLELSATKLVD